MSQLPEAVKPALFEFLLSLADDKLILGHRNADWTGLGPILEEDIAFSSMAQDEIGHAQAIYELLAPLMGRTPDGLAYGRRPEEYRCAQIVELSDGFDYAVALARQLACDHFDQLRLERLGRSNWADLSALARRMAAEELIHVTHAKDWVTRLGTGGAESKQRMQAALDQIAALAGGLFEPTEGLEDLQRSGVYPRNGDMWGQWLEAVQEVTRGAGLKFEPGAWTGGRAGRRGVRSAAFAELHAEMTQVYVQEPEASW